MKKTLLALLAMTACAMGDTLTFSTAPEYGGSEGGSYAGIVFTLGANDPERFALTGEIATPMVDLVSISLTERGSNNLADDRILYVTDSNNVYLGSSSVFTRAEGSDVAVFDLGGPSPSTWPIPIMPTSCLPQVMMTGKSERPWFRVVSTTPARSRQPVVL